MPSIVQPAFCQLLLNVFVGAATPPQYFYLGLGSAAGQEIGTTDGGNPPQPSGYARIKIPVSSLKVSGITGGGTLTIPTETWTFTAVPSQNIATAWQLWSAATGGGVYAAGPLNPGVVTGALTAAASAGGHHHHSGRFRRRSADAGRYLETRMHLHQ